MSARIGLVYMVGSCVCFAAMASLVYATELAEPEVSSLVASFARVVVNLVLLCLYALWTGDVHDLIGDLRPSLWWRGAFGSFALVLSFAAIKAIGVGDAQFLCASNGVFVALLAPLVLKQPNHPRAWVAIAGSVIGLYLLFEPRLGDEAPWGRAMAIASGFLSALAYLMIARAGRSNSPNSVVFYLCFIALFVHGALFTAFGATWPTQPTSYVLLALVGLSGSLGQFMLTKAYQLAPAALNSAVSYVQPVIALGFNIVFFAKAPDLRAIAGGAIVVAFGAILPFSRPRR
jgi:drug/metabolite transporter (DMT)-like permease